MDRNELAKIDDEMLGAWNDHNLSVFLSHCADDIAWHDPAVPEPINGKEGTAEFFTGWVTAFPDMNVRQTNRVIGDDTIAAQLIFTGTNTGPMQMGEDSIPATGNTVASRGADFARIKDGMLAEMHTYPDLAGMMQQLGLAG